MKTIFSIKMSSLTQIPQWGKLVRSVDILTNRLTSNLSNTLHLQLLYPNPAKNKAV